MGWTKAFTWIRYALLGWLGLVFLLLLTLSMKSRMYYDQGFMTYLAYLINEHDFVPYKDLFEFNMPASYWFHMAMGKVLGYSDVALRVAHVIVFTLLMAFMWFIQRPNGRLYAYVSCMIFGIFYLERGGSLLLQRDALAIVPVATAVLLNTRSIQGIRDSWIPGITGFLFALAALIKPHAVVGLPFVMIYQLSEGHGLANSWKVLALKFLRLSLFTLGGFILPMGVAAWWLWNIEAWSSFLEIFSSFVPVYAKITGSLTPFEGSRLEYLVRHIIYYLRLQYGNLALYALFGVYLFHVSTKNESNRRRAYLLLSLVFAYAVYVVLGGKFWDYHWLLFQYFAAMCAAYCFTGDSAPGINAKSVAQFLFLLVFAIVSTLKPAYKGLTHFRSEPIPLEGSGIESEVYYRNVEEIRTYLEGNMNPGDAVQPLDWIVGGAVHGMLLAGAVPATRHITDYEFYFYPTNPYVQEIRASFINDLVLKKPRFIIKSYYCELLLEKYTNDSFPELGEFVQKHYSEEYSSEYFKILLRNP